MRYVIIGSGAAGISAAAELREGDQEGDILVFSQDMGAYSRCMLHRYLSGERTIGLLRFIDEDFWREKRIEHRKDCPVLEVCPQEKKLRTGAGELFYDRLLIASGSVYAVPPIPGFRTADNVYGFRDLKDAKAIDQAMNGAKQAFLVGSGLVGMDVAYALLKRGISVVIAEMAPRIIPLQTDEVSAGIYQRLFEEAGASFRLGKGVVNTRVDGQNRITAVVMADGEEVPCDFVVAAAGVRPNIGFLQDSGIRLGRGIEVDEYLQTSEADVFAAGDVTGLSGIWTSAVSQGKTAARNMLGAREVRPDLFGMKNSMNFFGVPMISVGAAPESLEGCRVLARREGMQYRKIIEKDQRVIAVQLVGQIGHGGIFSHLIQNRVPVECSEEEIFVLNMAEFYGFTEDAGKRRRQRMQEMSRQ